MNPAAYTKATVRRALVIVSILAMLSSSIPIASAGLLDPIGDGGDLWAAPGPGTVVNETGAPGEAIYIVLHQAPPVVRYAGEVPGLAATSPSVTGESRLDVSSPAARAYLTYLATTRAVLHAAIENATGRTVPMAYEYDVVLNGFAVRLTAPEAALVADLPGVARVERDSNRYLLTDNGPDWIGAGAVHDGSATPGPGSLGEGIVAGIIDTGINHDHPSFAATGPVDGYVHTNPRGTFYGTCDPLTGLPSCNAKLIGVYDFTGTSPEDDNGHGSHTASTVAGNVVDAELVAPTITTTRRISGVAPHANIIAYKACVTTPAIGTCPISGILASIDQATTDAVDVINFSIGGGSSNPWSDLDSQAFLGAREAGIFVATSAGNDGPGAATLGSPADAPWVLSVAASTHDRRLQNALIDMSGGDTTSPADIFGKSNTAGLPETAIVYAGDVASALTSTPELCGVGVEQAEESLSPWPPGTFNGEIVVCDRGTFGRVEKARNVMEAGAGGYVLINDADNGNSTVADGYPVPGVHISFADGQVLKAWLASGTGHTAAIRGSAADTEPAFGDVMAGFSSRGPNPAFSGLVKPDVTAPGVDILAAFNSPAGTLPGDPPEFNVISGTSMSSPHVAGAGALVRAIHPDWTPDEVKSALMTTAFSGLPGTGGEVHEVLKEDGTTPTDPFDRGAGRVDLRGAALAGLVMDVAVTDYAAADPSSGGDPTSLNIASFGDGACLDTCGWMRTVRSTVAAPVTWTASFSGDAGLGVAVSPASFTVSGGASATFDVTADVTAVAANRWHFGTLTLTPDAVGLPAARFPVAVLALHDTSVPTVTLHMHGNVHDGCTGNGRADLIACDGPFLSDDPVLDDAPAATWGPVGPLPDGTADRNIYDPNWVWFLTEPADIAGPMTVRFWASCGGCADGLLSADWTIRVFADTVLVSEERVSATPALPNVPDLLEATTVLPAFSAAGNVVIQIEPVYIDGQENSIIYYDSSMPCSPATTGPCDSVVLMPVTSGGGANRPPVAVDDAASIESSEVVDVPVLANDFDPDGDAISLVSFTQGSYGSVTDQGGGVLRYTHGGADNGSDSFSYTITDGELTATGIVTITVSGGALTLVNSFVSSVGWVKPGDTYPFRVIVGNETGGDAHNAAVTIPAPGGVTFTQVTATAGAATIGGGGSSISWTVGTVSDGVAATLVVEAEAATTTTDPQIVWKDLSSTATLTYDELTTGAITSASHGPKVIPPTGGYETARYGDRPFPVVPVDYFDRKHEPAHTGDELESKINSPTVPGSTFNLYQEMSLGQLFPHGTVPSAGIASAGFEGDFEFTELQPAGACTGLTFKDTAGTLAYDERIADGWYQLPGDTNYYGADRYTFAGSIGGAVVGVPPLMQIDDACGPTGKAVYDAAHIADPEIDYNDYDTDKDGVVDFFMMVFAGLGGNGDSQINGTPPYDNIWPHSSSLEFYYTDAETGLKGYVSADQLKSLEDVPQCWVSDAYQEFDDCAASGGSGDDGLPVHVRVGPYNVNPEGAIDNASVISHEYGHSLGLPDFYSLGSRATYGDWNLMATDKSQNMDIFSKQELGWIVPVPLQPGTDPTAAGWKDSKVDTGEIHWVQPDGSPYTLQDGVHGPVHNADAYVAKLPTRQLIDPATIANSDPAAASASHVWWSGSGNDFGCPPLGGHNFDVYLPELADLPPGTAVTLEFGSMWNIEWDYDYGFVLASGDFGESYTSLPSANGYTTGFANPNANGCQGQYGNGLTGTTASYTDGTAEIDRVAGFYPEPTEFVVDSYDLSGFVGSPTVLRFSYATDPGLARPGWFIDNLRVLADGDVIYSSDFESGGDEARLFNGGCQGERGRVAQTCTAGWHYVDSSTGSPADHAYYLEMRDRSGFDADGKGENDRDPIAFQPGLLLVYTDETHGYGNVGTDDPPAQSPVDSRPQPGNNTPNLNDAAFKEGDAYTDDGSALPAGPAWTDNYADPNDPYGQGYWRHVFDCLSFTVDSMAGTDVGPAFNLVGDVVFDMGPGCVEFTYGADPNANTAPTAVAQARPELAGVGESIAFDGTASFDAETPPSGLTYEWDFDYDGSAFEVDATGSSTTHAYGATGTYTAALRVTDPGGLSDLDTVEITITGNGGPNAVDDSATTDEDTAVDVAVLANDTDPEGGELTVVSASQPAHGTTAVNPDGTVTYTPDPNFAGTDTFSYTVRDDGGLEDSAIVTVTVNEVNDQPVAADDAYETARDTTLEVTAPGVLGNDTDVDGDDLTASGPTAGPFEGTVVVNGDGSFTYTPEPGYTGTDQFAYEVSDGRGGTGSATVVITVRDTGGEECRNDLCADGDKPAELTLTYRGGDCSESGNTQGDKSTCTDHSATPPPTTGSVWVLATDKESAGDAKARVFFAGSVDAGETFTIDAANAGKDDFGSKVFLHVFAADGGELLQTVEVHTSCSAPLVEGERFGSFELGDGVPPADAEQCSDGGGRVHGSGHWAYQGDDGKDSKLEFSFDAKFDKGSLKGKLKVKDKGTGKDKSDDVEIDAKTITSLTNGEGSACHGLVLDGVSSFEFTATGTFKTESGEVDDATFRGCGVDNGDPGKGTDVFFVEVLTGGSYDTGSRLAAAGGDDVIDGGNVHLHDAITTPNDGGTAGATTAPDATTSGDSKASRSEVTGPDRVGVVDLDPMLVGTLPVGTPFALITTVHTVGGLDLGGRTVSLEWIGATGTTGSATAVTNDLGIAVFTITVRPGVTEYTAWVDGLDSNPMTLTGML
jgi:M6 family metalloprotease-like protein